MGSKKPLSLSEITFAIGKVKKFIDSGKRMERPKLDKSINQKRAKKELISHYNKIYAGPIHECIYCGEDIDHRDHANYTIEHLIPQSEGGTYDMYNIRPCCLICNREKADFTVDEWLNILYREYDKLEEHDARKLYKIFRVEAVKRHVDRLTK